MKKIFTLFVFITLCLMSHRLTAEPNTVTCTFFMYPKAPVGCHTYVSYQGNAPSSATFNWNFDGGIIMSGSGPGPYYIIWNTLGYKTVTLHVIYNSDSCNSSMTIHIVPVPQVYSVTGGGSYPYGGQGVHIGLSGSQLTCSYYLYLDGSSSSVANLEGTGNQLDFGLFTAAGTYICKAKYDSTSGACMTTMADSAIVTIGGSPPTTPYICMVTYDTATSKNKIIWNKPTTAQNLDHYNLYKETYQYNVYSKIAEIPFSNMSIYVDTDSNPLVRSDRYKLSVTDTSGLESDKSAIHMSIHLNINAGIDGFNLIWNYYMGFDFLTYRIHRKAGSGPWTVIDSVPMDITSYTDFYTQSGLSTYYIEVVRPYPCYPSLKSTEYSSVVSNVATSAPYGIGENQLSGVKVYPNPVNDKLIISSRNDAKYEVEITGLDGRSLIRESLAGTTNEVNVTSLTTGIYILKIKGEEGIMVRKIVKN